MASNMNTTMSEFTAMVKIYYNKKGLERLVPESYFYKDAKKIPLPQNDGNQIYMHKLAEYTSVGGYLVEGTTPTQGFMSAVNVPCYIRQRGYWVQVSDMLARTAVEPAITAMAENLGEAAAWTFDKEILYRLTGGQNKFQSEAAGFSLEAHDSASPLVDTAAHLCDILGGQNYGLCCLYISSTGSVQTDFMAYIYRMLSGQAETTGAAAIQATVNEYQINPMRIGAAVAQLRTNNCPTFTDGFYHGHIHPKLASHIMRNDEFMSWSQYQRAEKGEKGVIGDFGGVRWYSNPGMTMTKSCLTAAVGTTLAMTSVTFSACPVLIYGPGCFGVTEIEGERGFEVIRKKSGDTTVSDPLSQTATVGYKVELAAAVLDQKRGYFVWSFYTGV